MRNLRSQLRSALLLALWLGCAACSTTATYRMYDGDRALTEVATVIWDGSIRPLIHAVDGKEVPQAKVAFNRAEVLPGRREFTIVPIAGPTTERLTWTVEAGRCYMASQTFLGSEREGNMVRQRYGPPRMVEQHNHPACTKR